MTPDEFAASLMRKGWVRGTDGEWFRPAVLHAGDTGPATELERDPGDGALGQGQVQVPASGRFLVRITAVRHRLLDEDNACEKYHVDCCRYAGLIPGDGPRTTKIETRQEKAEPGAEELVRIEIFKI